MVLGIKLKKLQGVIFLRANVFGSGYYNENGRPILRLHITDSLGKKRFIEVEGKKPYFYEKTGTKRDTSIPTTAGNWADRINVGVPGQVSQMRTDDSLEDNIPFDLRWKIDNGIECGIKFDENKDRYSVDEIEPAEPLKEAPEVMYWDIEVKNPGVIPQPEDPRYEIASIAVGFRNNLTCFMQKGESRAISFEFNGEKYTAKIYAFEEERELIKAFLEYVKEKRPHYMAGYNSTEYDLPYLCKRAKILSVNYNRLSPVGRVRLAPQKHSGSRQKYIKNTKIWTYSLFYTEGMPTPDLLKMYNTKFASRGEEESSSLEFVLGKAGISYSQESENISDLIGTDKLAKYNLRDVLGTEYVDKHYKLIEYFERARRIGGIDIDSAPKNSRIVDSRILRTGKELGYACEPAERPLTSTAQGAFVGESEPGLHEGVACFDVSAMYPSMILSMNIDILTKEIVDRDIPENAEPHDYILDKVKFDQDKEGIIPNAIRPTYEAREDLRGENLSEYEQINEIALKYVNNSFAGVMGMKAFRIYDPDVFNAITCYGKRLMQGLWEMCEDMGYPVIYGDTDSVFVVCPRDDVTMLEEKMRRKMNSMMRDWGAEDPNMRIKLDWYASQIFFSVKYEGGEWVPASKRYVREIDGKKKYKGIEIRRSDASDMMKETMKEFFDVLFDEGPRAAGEYIHDVKDNFRNTPIKKLKIPKGVKKKLEDYDRPSAVVRGLKYARDHCGITVKEDRKPSYLYVKGVRSQEHPDTDVISFYGDEPPVPVTVDWKKMEEKTIDDKFEKFFKALDMDMHDLSKKKTLDEWME